MEGRSNVAVEDKKSPQWLKLQAADARASSLYTRLAESGAMRGWGQPRQTRDKILQSPSNEA